ERLKFNDKLAHGTLFKEWAPFNHPDYGEIEIGGWIKFSTRMPPLFMVQEMAHRNAAAVIYAATQTPEIELELIRVRRLEGRLFEVDVRVKNSNVIPSMSYHAVQRKLYPMDILKVSGASVVAGGEITDRHNNKVNYKIHRPEVQFLQVPGNGVSEFRFLVEGSGNIDLTYESVKAGKRNLKVSLR
ncbi:MAG: hypothetical protein R6W78_04850, partial [Bacteroidales bacterium]